ncbi:hypothetical protein ACPW96_16620 [Micromonospora sp. DT81.3]|uniref:hypothetical protein n=1 Tax=Micromonospora sp. DT81.3 TaxID=3416523 RepID=UPI003CF6B0FF
MDYFVSTTGSDENPGTLEQPFATIGFGAGKLTPGDHLWVRKGTYLEQVEIKGRQNTRPPVPMTIAAYQGERVIIDGAVNAVHGGAHLFRETTNDDWDRLGTSEEYVSKNPLPAGVAKGCFRNRRAHTRLITYSTLEDLRADNQKFGHMPGLMAPTDPPGELARDPKHAALPRRPWVYMGPGIHQHPKTLKVHIRLTHTTHDERGVTNYTGTTDPRQVGLAICTDAVPTVKIQNCDGIVLRGLRIRGGGGTALAISQSSFTVVDTVTLLGGPDVLLVHDASRHTRLHDCVIDGGLPPWMFRSDLKSDYTIDATGVVNVLGKQTVDSLLRCGKDIDDLVLDHCELVNSHDMLLLAGTDVELDHCWIDNINDDALIIASKATRIRVHHCAFDRVLTFLNLVSASLPGGSVLLYRNLVDLRRPTVGRRPHPRPEVLNTLQPDDDPDPQDHDELQVAALRLGQFFKADPNADPDLAIFHNTVLVVDPEGAATYPYFLRYDGLTSRRVINNLLVSINHRPGSDRLIAVLPRPSDEAISDGNLYHRIGQTSAQPFFHRSYEVPSVARFKSFDGLRTPPSPVQPSTYFDDTQLKYPPGVEFHGVEADPLFAAMQPWPLDQHVLRIDDFRLTPTSPARNHGAPLPGDLADRDPDPADGVRDIGCFEHGVAPLAVGVGGRRRFPQREPEIAPR